MSTARGEVGIVVYESKGVDSRRTNSGHIALIATNLCVEGIDEVRSCNAGEEPGVVVTRYLNLAYGYDRSVFVAPISAHFTATSDPGLIPALTTDDTLEAMQIAYWRQYLRPYLPPLSQERYEELLHRFDPGRTVRGILSLETMLGALEPHKGNPTAAIALVDPVTRELIPNGNWREAIGAAHVRSSMLITAPARLEQETRLIAFIAAVNKRPFQAITDNCSDFVERGLLTVFGDSGLHFRPRIAMVADAWVTNPLAVVTDFLAFAKREDMPITVVLAPMIAGTRRPTAPIHSLTRGALVPNPSQGKLLFGIKLAINTVNPLLGVAAYTVDKLSRFADLEQLAHERGGGELSRISYEIRSKANASGKDLEAWHREQVRVFGTTSCWKAKQDAFRALAAAAHEAELLSAAERALLLRRDRPFLLPRWYARAAEQKRKGAFAMGTYDRPLPPVGPVPKLSPTADGSEPKDAATSAVAFGTGRPEIRKMADLPDRESRVTAFRVMLSVINYDLSSEPARRRTSEEFDQDWTLFLNVAQKDGLRVPVNGVAREGVADCSCREFDEGRANRDALAHSLGFSHGLVRESRELVFGRTR
ncbi:MAG: hypothetical protein DLM53_04085 [Candidatus Eremiobacter antarcticus]|nr:MAG: hypothetical protein DLM53_04085 [Candidatus Eremiobacter sp. RRmetagenome_bin22]